MVFVVEIRGGFDSKIALKKNLRKKSDIRILNFSCLSPAHYFSRFFAIFAFSKRDEVILAGDKARISVG